jgi:hypothetical protein
VVDLVKVGADLKLAMRDIQGWTVDYPSAGLVGNFCRNPEPDQYPKACCNASVNDTYTMAVCDVPDCGDVTDTVGQDSVTLAQDLRDTSNWARGLSRNR